jgi:hypothetical protein
MSRWVLAGCLALAALGAAAVLDVGSATAEAAPSVSPFAGTYVGADPRSWHSSWTVTISDAGQLTTSPLSSHRQHFLYGASISGQVRAGGKYSFTVTRRFFGSSIEGRRPGFQTRSYKSAGRMALDADGNIVGKSKTGETFAWVRQ